MHALAYRLMREEQPQGTQPNEIISNNCYMHIFFVNNAIEDTMICVPRLSVCLSTAPVLSSKPSPKRSAFHHKICAMR